ncbi:recombinase family protein [Bradyrhizobium sp. CB3481]|uniref:recombinase family protein n=1 Tax=Bradyrhizobium sp. CB3481 TaxID=3039158 RepID=UPI0024B17819|nr:recombinase family protein [Bradyrhizobium sp. CB3481]WFU14603.1 recombinase family protein [Bradyrhizobium sp. CB3481]
MLISLNVADERLTTAHRAKLAYVYVRQSSVNQVRQHQESTELQYRLVDRAIGLGWPPERVQVIDEDLGKSGAGAVDRHGFQKLIAEIGLGNAGLVVSLDASRLARNNRDWHQLLELCSVFSVLIADGERLYDPRAYHDRLLLGLSGIMSEAELHQLRMRLHQGERQKAARGELRLPLPAGLAYDRAGAIVLNPDEEVQARLRLVFAKFRELQSARRVMRYLDRNGLSLPVRPLLGPSPHEIVWRAPDSARVLSILQNPAYAGAYVYGRRQKDPSRCRLGSLTGTVKVAIADWAVCLHAAHPGYISWEEFMANQGRLADNVCRYEAGHTGVPRKGAALLQGIAICGRCGRRMSMRYTGPNADYPVYCCRSDRDQQGSVLCQEVRALAVDGLVERVVLDALVPDQIEIALAAAGQLEQESRQLERQWALRVERARYEAERARRQYDTVEPENRLVARSLERAWEEKLRVVEAVEQEHARWRAQEPLLISPAERTGLQALGENLPRIWNAATTSAADRKRILRFVIREVVLDQKRTRGQVWLKIVWQTGATTEHHVQRRVHTYRDYVDIDQLRQRILELHAEHKMDGEIAAILNQEGFVAARGCAFKGENVWVLRTRWGIPTVKINGVDKNPMRWPDGSFSIQGAAAELGVTPQTVFDYLARGLLAGRQPITSSRAGGLMGNRQRRF